MRDFRFTTGEVLPEPRMHYYTLGKAERDSQGVVRNAVLVLHGTGDGGHLLMVRRMSEHWPTLGASMS
ncbi:MAG: hypothetical protein ABW034_16790 [Steroidobacteraceae bacterium]